MSEHQDAEQLRVATAPGRVNLIGDHTDYTSGWCLPMAIDRAVVVSGVAVAGSGVVELFSEAFGETARIPLGVDDVRGFRPGWARYAAAVVRLVRPSTGFRGVIRSTLPIASGLSSSAALEVAVALALGGDRLGPVALAQLCQAAEHEARGVPTGLLDQLATIFGRAGHAVLVDCSTNTTAAVPLPDAAVAELVVVDAGPRSLSDSGYTQRVEECVAIEARIGPLRTASAADVALLDDPVLRRRARHVITENARVHDFVEAMRSDDVGRAGSLMSESHRSLRDDYESSTPAVDALCARLGAIRGVLGVRITGGGWGGCVVALTRPGALAGEGLHVVAADGASVGTQRG